MKKKIPNNKIKMDAKNLLTNAEMQKIKGGQLASSDPCACKSGCRTACISGGQLNP
jgi:hypothetical protein